MHTLEGKNSTMHGAESEGNKEVLNQIQKIKTFREAVSTLRLPLTGWRRSEI